MSNGQLIGIDIMNATAEQEERRKIFEEIHGTEILGSSKTLPRHFEEGLQLL